MKKMGKGARIEKPEKMAQKKLKATPKDKKVKISDPVDETHYRKVELKANKQKRSMKLEPASKKVKRTVYD
jgi:hypothetical protein